MTKQILIWWFAGIKAHFDSSAMDMSDSEEDEYNNAGVVYDSENSDEEFNSDDDDAVR